MYAMYVLIPDVRNTSKELCDITLQLSTLSKIIKDSVLYHFSYVVFSTPAE